MSLADYFHSVATGPKRRRERLTPLGFLFFGSTLVVVVVGGRHTDGWLRLPPLLPGAIGTVLGAVFLTAGIWLCGWCVARFLRARGTPVPLNPPDALIVSGPYALVRNPMLTGVFGALLGLGLLLHSIGVVLIWTPAYALVHLIELKCVEEPELARRFGPSYEKYRAQVPMFIPRLRRHHPMRSIVVLFCAAMMGGNVFEDLVPRVADNRYPGRRLGLWLFGLMLLKVPMGVNVMINAPSVATSADGIPVDTYGGAAASAFSFVFAAWGLGQLLLGLSCLVVLLRYRSLVPLAFLALLLEQAGRKLLALHWPIERTGSPPGAYINAVLLGIIVLGLVLSLWRKPTQAHGI